MRNRPRPIDSTAQSPSTTAKAMRRAAGRDGGTTGPVRRSAPIQANCNVT